MMESAPLCVRGSHSTKSMEISVQGCSGIGRGPIESSVLTLSLALLANLIPFHKVFHIFLQLGPILLLLYHKEYFVAPKVPTEATGMQFSNQFFA